MAERANIYRHVVLFKFKDTASAETVAAIERRFPGVLRHPALRHGLRVGPELQPGGPRPRLHPLLHRDLRRSGGTRPVPAASRPSGLCRAAGSTPTWTRCAWSTSPRRTDAGGGTPPYSHSTSMQPQRHGDHRHGGAERDDVGGERLAGAEAGGDQPGVDPGRAGRGDDQRLGPDRRQVDRPSPAPRRRSPA